MKVMILLGAPGAGKGSVAEQLKQSTQYAHVSTGDMLRTAVKAGTEVGRQAKSYMEAGELVPDDVIIGIVRERMDADGQQACYMFDGFPRTQEQARLLDTALAQFGSEVNKVFQLDVPREILIQRLTGRRICTQCGAVYHVINMPPRVEGACDTCGGALIQRPDDGIDVVENRLDVYQKQTASLIDYYQAKGVLVSIDAAKHVDETKRSIMESLAE